MAKGIVDIVQPFFFLGGKLADGVGEKVCILHEGIFSGA